MTNVWSAKPAVIMNMRGISMDRRLLLRNRVSDEAFRLKL